MVLKVFFCCCFFEREREFSNGFMLSVTFSEVTEHNKVEVHGAFMPARQLSHHDC